MISVRSRPLLTTDWPAVGRIYAQGIATGNATFEAHTPSWAEFAASKRTDLRMVAVDEKDAVLGWVAGSPVSTRHVYRGVIEHSIYITDDARGHGVGSRLLADFIAAAERVGVWTIQSGIFPENESSRALHSSLGFRTVGVRERIGLMSYGPWAGQWRDNILIERRIAD